jgi:hypothetical protein
METTRTVVCKLAPTPDQARDIENTRKAFAGACDFAAETARRIGSTNKVKVQHAAYAEIRKRFGLSANLAIRAIARACAALKVPAKMHSKFAATSIDYDQRIFEFSEWNWTFGLTLLAGRVKIATRLGERQTSLVKGREPTTGRVGMNSSVAIVGSLCPPIGTPHETSSYGRKSWRLWQGAMTPASKPAETACKPRGFSPSGS